MLNYACILIIGILFRFFSSTIFGYVRVLVQVSFFNFGEGEDDFRQFIVVCLSNIWTLTTLTKDLYISFILMDLFPLKSKI